MISAILLAALLQNPLVEDLEGRYANVRKSAAASIVSIDVDREADEKVPKPPPGLMGLMQVNTIFAHRPAGPVTGTVIDPDGWILTTRFNIAGTLKSITVTLPDGRKLPAELKGWEELYDIALLKVDAHGLKALPVRKDPDLVVGENVVALGSDGSGGVTLNPGIVSALDRMSGHGVQHDARLNYANVGGPLVDLWGRLVGMTNKVSVAGADDPGQNSGVGFAVTWSRIADSLPHLKSGERTRAPFLGIMGKDGEGGVKIEQVIEGGSAKVAGIQVGDVILEFGGKPCDTMAILKTRIEGLRVGESVHVKYKRGEEVKEMDVKLGERPEDK